VINEITIEQPHVSASDIEAGIKKALVHTAEVDADMITIATEGAVVTLTGTVRSWAERDAAEDVVWRARGVTQVVNSIVVQP
jgi:osmotically-inducible protein OsmY